MMTAPKEHLRAARPGVSVVVPAFNEAANLPSTLTSLAAALRALADRWEVIVVDDGSSDATPAAISPWLVTPGVR